MSKPRAIPVVRGFRQTPGWGRPYHQTDEEIAARRARQRAEKAKRKETDRAQETTAPRP